MVTLAKFSDASPYGGHSSQTSYEKTSNGMVPEYVLTWRRHEMRGVRITPYQALSLLQHNNPTTLADFFAGRL